MSRRERRGPGARKPSKRFPCRTMLKRGSCSELSGARTLCGFTSFITASQVYSSLAVTVINCQTNSGCMRSCPDNCHCPTLALPFESRTFLSAVRSFSLYSGSNQGKASIKQPQSARAQSNYTLTMHSFGRVSGRLPPSNLRTSPGTRAAPGAGGGRWPHAVLSAVSVPPAVA